MISTWCGVYESPFFGKFGKLSWHIVTEVVKYDFLGDTWSLVSGEDCLYFMDHWSFQTLWSFYFQTATEVIYNHQVILIKTENIGCLKLPRALWNLMLHQWLLSVCHVVLLAHTACGHSSSILEFMFGQKSISLTYRLHFSMPIWPMWIGLIISCLSVLGTMILLLFKTDLFQKVSWWCCGLSQSWNKFGQVVDSCKFCGVDLWA